MKMIRLPDVIKKTGISRSSLYKYMDAGKFPKPLHLGERTVAWVESEIDDWLMEKVRERNSSE